MQGFKSAILPKVKNCQYGTFELLHEILFFTESILLKSYETALIRIFIENVPGYPKSMVRVCQRTKRGFSKKALQGFEKSFLFWVGMNPSNP